MDDERFDRITRVVATSSRRQVLRGLAGGAVGALLTGLGQEEASAVCRLEAQRCSRKRRCCLAATCQRQGDNKVCVCPEEQQFRGPDKDGDGEGDPVCCAQSKICKSLSGEPQDDKCCYPDEECVNNDCCCDGCRGAKICFGVCCASASCCEGKCCDQGEWCARKHRDAPLKCVASIRICATDKDCLFRETCVASKCCSEQRTCPRDELGETDPNGAPVCCKDGYYCDRSRGEDLAQCCPVNEGCTFRAARFRR